MKTDNVLATRPHKVIYRDGDKVWKVFDANYPKTDVLNEALNQARVEETGLPIPGAEPGQGGGDGSSHPQSTRRYGERGGKMGDHLRLH